MHDGFLLHIHGCDQPDLRWGRWKLSVKYDLWTSSFTWSRVIDSSQKRSVCVGWGLIECLRAANTLRKRWRFWSIIQEPEPAGKCQQLCTCSDGARTNTFCRSARLQLCGVFHPRWGKRSRRQIKAEEGIYHHYRLQSEHRKLLYSLWNVLQLAFTCDSRGSLLKNCFLKCWDKPFKGDEEECTEVRLRGRNCQEICCNLDQNLLFTRSTTFIKPTLLEQFTFHRITRFVGFQWSAMK